MASVAMLPPGVIVGDDTAPINAPQRVWEKSYLAACEYWNQIAEGYANLVWFSHTGAWEGGRSGDAVAPPDSGAAATPGSQLAATLLAMRRQRGGESAQGVPNAPAHPAADTAQPAAHAAMASSKKSFKQFLEKWKPKQREVYHTVAADYERAASALRQWKEKLHSTTAGVSFDGNLVRVLEHVRQERHMDATVQRMREVQRKVLERLDRARQKKQKKVIEGVREMVEGSPLHEWSSLPPARLPTECAPYFKLWKRDEDIQGHPATRCEAFFPDVPHGEIVRLMSDPATRLSWDKNLTDFEEVDAEGRVFYHKIESNVLKKFGFHGRDFLYRKSVESCGERCVDITLQSVEESVLGRPVGVDESGRHTAVRGTIHYQNYRISEEARNGEEGTTLTITAVVETGARPPKYIATLVCKLMAAQPYLWMREHLHRTGVTVAPPPAPVDLSEARCISSCLGHFALLE